MDTPYSLDPEKLDVALARLIDAACRRFEQRWRAGESPTIEDQLAVVEGPGRAALLVELIALECELVGKTGVPRRIADYLARFPGREREVAQAFGSSNQAGLASSVESEAETISPIASANLPATTITDVAALPPSRRLDNDVTADLEITALEIEPPVRPAGNGAKFKYFGDYILERELARGGMGVVYKARQVSLNRAVALKMILAGPLASGDDVKRFDLEAEAAANLDHPGIVPIFEVGQHDGQHFFSMGFVEGQSLAQKIAENPLPPREAATLIVQLAEAVQYAHDQGVVHRDLKPSNVLLDAHCCPKVTDFGLAKKLQGDSGLTHTGQVMGTPSYMPPEQAEGASVGPLADVYALGAILYCLLTGRPPFQAASPMDTLMQVLDRDPIPPRQLNSGVPADLETITLKALEKQPGKRYASAEALGADIDRWLCGEPILARPVGHVEKAAKWVRRRPVIAGLSAMVGVMGLAGLAGILWQWQRAEHNAWIARSNEQTAKNLATQEAKARAQAQDLAGKEAKAREEAQAQERLALEKAEQLAREDYVNRVNRAYREIQDDNVALAEDLLHGCDPKRRGWE